MYHFQNFLPVIHEYLAQGLTLQPAIAKVCHVYFSDDKQAYHELFVVYFKSILKGL